MINGEPDAARNGTGVKVEAEVAAPVKAAKKTAAKKR
jgi:hypothetical protein